MKTHATPVRGVTHRNATSYLTGGFPHKSLSKNAASAQGRHGRDVKSDFSMGDPVDLLSHEPAMSIRQLPDLYRAGSKGGCQALPIWAEGDTKGLGDALVCCVKKDKEFLAVCGIPYSGRTISADGSCAFAI